MMNKRGEEGGNYTGIIITIVVFALLLIILLVSFSGKSGGLFDSIKSIIPGSWGGVKPGLVEDGAFRYQVMSDSVQYYDGANWREFPSTFDIGAEKKQGVQIGDRVYIKEEVKTAYRSEYYGNTPTGSDITQFDYFKKRDSVIVKEFSENGVQVTYSITNLYDKPSISTDSNYVSIFGGDVVTARRVKGQTTSELYLFRYNGGVYTMVKNYRLQDSTKFIQVLTFVNAWRDSALKQPVTLSYYTYVKDDNGKEVLKKVDANKDKYCLEKIDLDLTIRLSSPNNGDICIV